MAIKISGNTVIDNSRNINAGIATFTELNVPPRVNIFSPADGATGVAVEPTIVITFNYEMTKGTGNITLRSGSATGTILETIAVSSGNVTISGTVVTINPVSILPNNTDIYVVIDAGAFTTVVFFSNTPLIDTYNFTTINFVASSLTPTNGATSVAANTNITLTFNSAPTRGTGTITLRSGSAGGTILESFDAASSNRISISGNNWILDPTINDLYYGTLLFLVIPNQAITNYVGLNVAGAATYSFTTITLELGNPYEGGFVICKASPLRWVVAPYSAEVSTIWGSRGNPSGVEQAVTRAQQVTGCAGWFLPTLSNLQNPGYICRSFWDGYSNMSYWSCCNPNTLYPMALDFTSGVIRCFRGDICGLCARAFRTVTY